MDSNAHAQQANAERVDLLIKSILERDGDLLDEVLSSDELDLNELLGGQYTALHLASNQGNLDAVIKLISSGADLDAREPENGWTPLMIAVYAGQETVAKALVLAGANIEIVGTDQSTARVLAKYSGMTSLFDQQEAQIAPMISQNELDELLLDAAEANDADLVGKLLQDGAKIVANDVGWTPLHYAAFWRNPVLLAKLSELPEGDKIITNGGNDQVSLVQTFLLGAASKPNKKATDTFVRTLDIYSIDLEATANSTKSNWELAKELNLHPDIIGLFKVTRRNFNTPHKIQRPQIILSRDMSKDDWREVQRNLSDLGLYTSTIDGIAGSGTRNAIFGFYSSWAVENSKHFWPECERLRTEAEALLSDSGIQTAIAADTSGGCNQMGMSSKPNPDAVGRDQKCPWSSQNRSDFFPHG